MAVNQAFKAALNPQTENRFCNDNKDDTPDNCPADLFPDIVVFFGSGVYNRYFEIIDVPDQVAVFTAVLF